MVLLLLLLLGQDISGDWRGTLSAGPAELRLGLHVTKDGAGWKATMDSIDQGVSGIPVSSFTVAGTDVKFTVDSVRGSYTGKVNGAGSAISGTWTQGQPLPLNFERGTFAVVEHKPAKPSDIDGTWSGSLNAGGQTLRLVFHIVNTADGLTATLDVPDQRAKAAPVTSVTRDGTTLKMEIKAVGAVFEGRISEDRKTISGTMTQMGNAMPLELTRS